MTRSRLATAALAGLLCAAATAPANAKLAFPPLCTVPAVVVGCPSGAALPSCGTANGGTTQTVPGFRLVLRDFTNAPMANVTVLLDFSATPVRLLGDERPGTIVNCAARVIQRVTDAQGVVVFAPRFCGGTEEARVRITADGVWVREIPARSTDLDGNGETGLSDFARVARNFLDGTHDAATDFDSCSGEPGITTLADFAVFASELLRAPAGVACP